MKSILKIFLSLIIIPSFAYAQQVEEIIYDKFKEVRYYRNTYIPGNYYDPDIGAEYDLPSVFTGLMTGPNTYDPNGLPKLIPGGTIVQKWINSHPEVIIGTQTLCDISPGSPNCQSYVFPIYDVNKIPVYYSGTQNTLDNRTYDAYLVSLGTNYTMVDGVPIVIGYNDTTAPTTPTTPTDGSSPTPIQPPVVVQDCSNPDYSKKTSSSICLVGQVIEGCKLTTDNYQASINVVAGNVGLTSVDLKITCSTGVNYHLKPIHDMISIPGTQETLKLTGWKDSGRGDKLTPLSAKVMSGNGSEQSIPIYFTLEGKGPTGTYGNAIVNKFVGTAVYPVQIDY